MRCLPIRLFFAAFYFVALFFFLLAFLSSLFFITNQTSFSLFFWTVFFPAIFLAFFIWRFFSRDFFYCFWTELFFSHESDGLLFVYCFWTGLFFRTNQTFWRRFFRAFSERHFFQMAFAFFAWIFFLPHGQRKYFKLFK